MLPIIAATFLMLLLVTSSPVPAAPTGSDDVRVVVEYRVLEEQAPSVLVGNVLIDSRLHLVHSADVLVTLRFRIASVSPSSMSDSVAIDPSTGLLRTSRRIDREHVCPVGDDSGPVRSSKSSSYVAVDATSTDDCIFRIDVVVTPVKFFQVRLCAS